MKLRFALIAGVVTFLISGHIGLCQQTASQEQGAGQRASLVFDVSSITGEPGQTIPMKITVSRAAENPFGFVLIRGIPSQFKLSSSFLNGKDWLVSLSVLESLQLVVPEDFEGRFDFEVVLVLQGSSQRQTRSASVAIQPALWRTDPLQWEPADVSLPEPADALLPIMPSEPEARGNGVQEPLKRGDVGTAVPGVPPLAADLEPSPRTDPAGRPNADDALTEREMGEFCSGQSYMCRKVCRLRRDRENEAGCTQTCDRRVAGCNRTGCYRWTDPDFVIAERFGARQCAQ